MKYYKYFNRLVRSNNNINVEMYYNNRWVNNNRIAMDMFSSFGDEEYTEITEYEAFKLIDDGLVGSDILVG